MRVAITGLPQSGKTTLFTAATGNAPDAFASPQTHLGIVKVPDPRLDFLSKLCKPKKYTPATIEFMDVPGFSLEDARGRDDFRKIMAEVRLADVLVVVVRDFENAAVPAYKDRIEPVADMATTWEEFLFADLEAVTNRIERLEQALRKPTRTHEEEKRELDLLQQCRDALESTRPLSDVLTSDEDRRALASFAFLTEKPVVAVRNVDESRTSDEGTALHAHACDQVSLCASVEAEIAQLAPEDRGAFLADLGIDVPRDRLVRSCYRAAGLISFLTMGPDEVRAWPVNEGSTAVESAGKIHSDLARGFIRAETVAYDDLVAHEDMKGARAAGKVRQEGKSYIVQDGDILNIKFNV